MIRVEGSLHIREYLDTNISLGDKTEARQLTEKLFEEVTDEDHLSSDVSDEDSAFIKAYVSSKHAFNLVRENHRSFAKATTIRQTGLQFLERFIELNKSPMAKHFYFKVILRKF